MVTASYLNNSNSCLIIKVIDKFDGKPIESATVCITDSRDYYYTDKDGLTTKILLSSSLKAVTIIIYKKGFHDYIRLSTKIYPNTTRTGIVINLIPMENEEDTAPTIETEIPDEEYINLLLKNNKK
ncbi:MAG: hypothetical protein RR334_02410 [Clostridia bacterium]